MKHLKTYEQVNVFDEKNQCYDIDSIYNEIEHLIHPDFYKSKIVDLDFNDFKFDNFVYYNIFHYRLFVEDRLPILQKILDIFDESDSRYKFSVSIIDNIMRKIYEDYNIDRLIEDKLIDILIDEPSNYLYMKEWYESKISDRVKSKMEFYDDGEELGLI